MKTKKTISPVVGTALLLVVAVVAVVGFQNWFSGFESGILSNTEQKSSNTAGSINVEFISSDGIIYITNTGNLNISMSTIKIGDTDCLINRNLTPGVNNISINSCLNENESISEIRLITDEGLFIEEVFTGEVIYTPLVITLSTSLSCTTDSDGDGQILWTCAIYPMSNLTYEGSLDPVDNNISIIDDKCYLKSDKSSCESNLVIDGCGTGTVLDLGTGLCWQQDMSSYLDYDGTTLNWVEAKTYCSNLNLGGHTNWELPTRAELRTLSDLSRSSYSIIGGNNNKFTNLVNGHYWTISTSGAFSANAGVIYFSFGSASYYVKANDGHVTCVVR